MSMDWLKHMHDITIASLQARRAQIPVNLQGQAAKHRHLHLLSTCCSAAHPEPATELGQSMTELCMLLAGQLLRASAPLHAAASASIAIPCCTASFAHPATMRLQRSLVTSFTVASGSPKRSANLQLGGHRESMSALHGSIMAAVVPARGPPDPLDHGYLPSDNTSTSSFIVGEKQLASWAGHSAALKQADVKFIQMQGCQQALYTSARWCVWCVHAAPDRCVPGSMNGDPARFAPQVEEPQNALSQHQQVKLVQRPCLRIHSDLCYMTAGQSTASSSGHGKGAERW